MSIKPEFNIKKSSRGLAALIDNDEVLNPPQSVVEPAPRIRPVIYKPGSAERNIEIELHTRPAYGLVLGRKAPKVQKKIDPVSTTTESSGVTGDDTPNDPNNNQSVPAKAARGKRSNDILSLFAFANVTKDLVTASLLDDPYADLLLLKIESLLQKLDDTLVTSIASVEHILKNLAESGVTARKMRTKYPTRIELTFRSPYAMKLAMLIVKYDQLVRMYLPVRQAHQIEYEQWQMAFEEPRQIFRQAVNHAINYRIHGITRQNIETLNTKEVNKLKKWYGPIPPEILSGQKKPDLIYGFRRV